MGKKKGIVCSFFLKMKTTTGDTLEESDAHLRLHAVDLVLVHGEHPQTLARASLRGALQLADDAPLHSSVHSVSLSSLAG